MTTKSPTCDTIKIVRVLTRLNIGGPAIHTILLSSELNKDGYKDILVCGRVSEHEGDMAYLAAAKGVAPLFIEELRREISPIRDARAFFRLYTLMKKERPAIVHTHTAKAGTLGRLAAVCAGVPVRVHTFHGHVFDGYFHPLKARIFIAIERILALITHKVIMVSEGVRHEIVDELKVAPRSKSAVIRLGLELGTFTDNGKGGPGFRRSVGVGADDLLVGIVGRLVPIKNHRMFLDAAARIKDGMPGRRVRFLVIGDGEMRQDLEAYAVSLGLKDDVIFTGWVRDLAAAYAAMDIATLTSLNEGTPVSLIEAMASARAVVATDVGGVRDVVLDGENGLLADAHDAGGFAAKVIALLSDRPRMAAYGARGREAAVGRFAKERLVSDMKDLYRGCLKNGSIKTEI